METYKEKVTNWIRDQIENKGLIDFKVDRMNPNDPFSPIPKVQPEQEEKYFEEIWRAINANHTQCDLDDEEVLGKYTPSRRKL